jgi:hypothetical protein
MARFGHIVRLDRMGITRGPLSCDLRLKCARALPVAARCPVENLHLIERWTRTSPTTLEYVVTIEDPTVFTAHGLSAKSSASRASKRTKSITSHAPP